MSILSQSYPNIEYILIDGASTDGTVDMIREYAPGIAFWTTEPDHGLYDAMKEDNPESILLGFKGGPSGLVDDNYITTVCIKLITVFFLFFVVKNI